MLTGMKNDISLAQWALVEEIRAGKWTTLDFPKIAREDFGLNGIEFVNTLFEVPTEGYLKKLKQNAAAHDVNMLLIMVDDEGDGCSPTPQGRREFELFHRKWVDIAHYLARPSARIAGDRGMPTGRKRCSGRKNPTAACWTTPHLRVYTS